MEDKLFAEYGVRKQRGGGSKVCSGAAKRIVR